MISFVVPAYNEADLIEACIHSIQVAAYHIESEIIVVDNGSTDNTALLAAQAGARVILEPVKGITKARQAGFQAAKYDVVAFIDADSELPKDWVEYALKALEQPNIVAASGPVIYYEMSLSKRIVSLAFYTVAKIAHLFFPMLQGGNFILRKQALKKAGGFNQDIDFYGEDTDTAIRLSKVGKIAFDLDMWTYTSARRMQNEGLLKVGLRYIANYLWMWAVGRPWSTSHHDHRPK